MKPFAYQYLQMDCGCLDDEEVCPTLRMLYEYAMLKGSFDDIDVSAIYPDRTRQPFTFGKRFKVKVDLDKEALLLEARGMIEADKMAWKEWADGVRARRKANGENENAVITITGSSRVSDYSEEDIVWRLTEQRQWRWKTVEEIDWAALEKELEKEG